MPPNYKCKLCGQWLATKGALMAHRWRLHLIRE